MSVLVDDIAHWL